MDFCSPLQNVLHLKWVTSTSVDKQKKKKKKKFASISHYFCRLWGVYLLAPGKGEISLNRIWTGPRHFPITSRQQDSAHQSAQVSLCWTTPAESYVFAAVYCCEMMFPTSSACRSDTSNQPPWQELLAVFVRNRRFSAIFCIFPLDCKSVS